MGEQKLKDMKEAMKFFINKLGALDRLAIVPFNKSIPDKFRNASLAFMTDQRPKDKAIRDIEGLKAEEGTNIKAGLEAGIKILNAERSKKHSAGKRASCVFLLSDGDENSIDKVSSLIEDGSVGNVTIHTFGFGTKHNEKVRTCTRSLCYIYTYMPSYFIAVIKLYYILLLT